jgi:hypothetical protein
MIETGQTAVGKRTVAQIVITQKLHVDVSGCEYTKPKLILPSFRLSGGQGVRTVEHFQSNTRHSKIDLWLFA